MSREDGVWWLKSIKEERKEEKNISKEVTEGNKACLDFYRLKIFFNENKRFFVEKNLIPAVVQDAVTKEVLLLAYVSEEALNYSLKHKVAAFYSMTRDEFWVKGLTSGCILELTELRVNCEQNSLLFLVKPVKDVSCHTRDENGNHRRSCFYRRLTVKDGKLALALD